MWLLEPETFYKMQQAYKANLTFSKDDIGAFYSSESAGSGIFSVDGETANISIKGVLTQERDFMAMLFGGGNTTYKEIIAGILQAEQNSNVKNITLSIDSPGGQFAGAFDVVAALQNTVKPIRAVVSNVCASAAYLIASQADQITATNHVVRVGSIGVVATFYMDESEVEITSSEAPNKRPDITTDEGKAIIRQQLDDLHNEFVDAIANGRGKTKEYVNANFGQGGVYLSREAEKRGMIDSVQENKLKIVDKSNKLVTNIKKPITEIKGMNLTEFKAQHPELYAQCVAEGVASERDRVCSHLMMGESSGDIKTAAGAIKDGSVLTATLQATYMAAAMNRNAITSRDDDNKSASAAVNGVKASDDIVSDDLNFAKSFKAAISSTEA